eukprot:210620-Chlamydomonas_euryale.AAC.2
MRWEDVWAVRERGPIAVTRKCGLAAIGNEYDIAASIKKRSRGRGEARLSGSTAHRGAEFRCPSRMLRGPRLELP